MFDFLKSEEKPPATRDRVIIFDTDQKTCEIMEVEAMNEEVIRAGEYTIPRVDLTLTLSTKGRVFVLNAPSEYVQHTQHLARVERNTVIRQIAQYKKPLEDLKTDWQKIALLGALVIVSVIAAAT